MIDKLKRLREWAKEQRDAASDDYKNWSGSVERGVLNAERIAYERVMGMADRLLAEPEAPPTDATQSADDLSGIEAKALDVLDANGLHFTVDGPTVNEVLRMVHELRRLREAARGDDGLLAAAKACLDQLAMIIIDSFKEFAQIEKRLAENEQRIKEIERLIDENQDLLDQRRKLLDERRKEGAS